MNKIKEETSQASTGKLSPYPSLGVLSLRAGACGCVRCVRCVWCVRVRAGACGCVCVCVCVCVCMYVSDVFSLVYFKMHTRIQNDYGNSYLRVIYHISGWIRTL